MTELLVIVALVLVNGLLAGAEIAIVSVRRSRLVELAAQGSAAARAVQRLRDDPESFLATVQVGITVIGAAAGAFGGAAFSADLEPPLRRVPILAPYASQIAFAAVVCTIAYLSVVLGELVPKSLALRSAETYSLLAARPLLAISRAARPVVWILSASSNAVLRLFGDQTTFLESRISSEEIRQVVEDAARSGDVHPSLGRIATRALGFAALTAEDLMVHRRFAFTLPAVTTLSEARRALVDEGRERAPVVEDSSQNVVGYVTWQDVSAAAPELDATSVRSVVRKAFHVPESMPAVELLRRLQERRIPLAVVVDEHGDTVGIVTLADVVGQLVGEMVGERGAPAAARIRPQPDGTALVDGIVPLPIVNRELHLHLPDDGRAATIGGLFSLLLGGRIPVAGERVRTRDGTTLVAVEVSPRRVRVVGVSPRRLDDSP